MTDSSRKNIMLAIAGAVEDHLRVLDGEIRKDSNNLTAVRGLHFDETKSDPASLRYEFMAQESLERRLALNAEERERWVRFSDDLYVELLEV